MKSEAGRAAYWRMQWESAVGALSDLIAEHAETVDELDRLRAERCTCNPAEVENGKCVLCGKPFPVGGSV